jgi:HK97 gp10 family phage protein
MSAAASAARAAMRAESAAIVRRLDGYAKELSRVKKGMLRDAAKPLVMAARNNAPVGVRVHYRYNQGAVVAEYYPGNLKRSLQILDLKKSPDVFVGPKVAKGSKGTFKGRRTDAYYAHMVEYGTSQAPAQPFMRPAWSATEGEVRRRVEVALRQFTARYK